MRKALL